jgi:hypothetical protein
MKKMLVFSVMTLVLVAGLYQLVSARTLASSNPTQKAITAVAQTPAKAPAIQSTNCVMDQGMCTGMTCDMSQCTMKFCDKQNGKCPPGQCKKCMP